MLLSRQALDASSEGWGDAPQSMTNGQWSANARPGSIASRHSSRVPSGRERVMALAVVGQPAAVSAAQTASMSSVRTAQLANRGAGSAAMAAPKPVGSASAGSGPSTSRYTPGPRPRIAFAVPIDGCEPPSVARAPARRSSSSTPAPKSGTTHIRWSIVAIPAILRR